MSERPAVCGLNNIMQAYEGMRGDSPYFSVWFNGREKAFQWNINDLNGGSEYLESNLRALATGEDNSLYYLRIHSVSLPVYDNNAKTVICGIPIRLTESGGSAERINEGVSMMNPQKGLMSLEMWKMFSAAEQVPELLKQNAALTQRLIDLQSNEKPTDTLGRITGFVGANPHVLQPIIASIGKLLSGFIPAGMMAGPVMAGIDNQPPVINSVPDSAGPEVEEYWDKVDVALECLQKHCDISVYLPKLADYAQKNPDMFKILLNNL